MLAEALVLRSQLQESDAEPLADLQPGHRT